MAESLSVLQNQTQMLIFFLFHQLCFSPALLVRLHWSESKNVSTTQVMLTKQNITESKTPGLDLGQH
jgi:hypothetical protein